MKIINKNYINGEFVDMDGTEVMNIIRPSTKEIIGSVTLGSERDVQSAVSAAKTALKTFSKTKVSERGKMLQRLHDVMMSRADELIQATVEEYGAPVSVATNLMLVAAKAFLHTKESLEEFEFVKYIGKAKVVMEPLGVVGMITPWNADYYQICAKLAPAIATGCTAVIKPSELSAIQTQVLLECFHEAGIPKGVINVVNGRGEIVGEELTRHPNISMISFTGSTKVGKAVRRGAVDTMKRVTLEMGGKSPNIILEDADFTIAIPLALRIAFGNSGQACIAGTRLIVPENRLEEVKQIIRIAAQTIKVGKLWDKDSAIGAIVNEKQFERVRRYIRTGIMEGAELVIGGEGSPQGLENGYYVQPTVFANVTMDMTIAKEEIFGPVLSILTYKTEAEAIEIANNTDYGLAAYISSTDFDRASRVASQIEAGRITINMPEDEPKAPFGGFKQSGIGRENGVFGMNEYVEPKTILGYM